MKDLHKIFTLFKEDFPGVHKAEAALGEQIHQHAGPLQEKARCLTKVAISAATRHHRALETHLERAREAGASEAEIEQTLLLIIPTCGFPTFMEAYSVFRGEG